MVGFKAQMGKRQPDSALIKKKIEKKTLKRDAKKGRF